MVKLFPGSRELLETSSLMLRPKVKPQFKWGVLSTVAHKTVLGVPCLCQAGYYFHTLKNTPFAFHPTAFREITQGVKNEALNKAIWSFPPSQLPHWKVFHSNPVFSSSLSLLQSSWGCKHVLPHPCFSRNLSSQLWINSKEIKTHPKVPLAILGQQCCS